MGLGGGVEAANGGLTAVRVCKSATKLDEASRWDFQVYAYDALCAEYFRQRAEDGAWSATMLGWARPDLRLATVLFDDLGCEETIKVSKKAVICYFLSRGAMSWCS